MYRKYLVFSLLFMSLIVVLQCGFDADVAGKVGNEIITVEEYTTALKNIFGKKAFSDIPHEEKIKTLEEMLDFRLRVIKARELGLDKDPKLELEVRAKANNMVAQKLYEAEIVDKVVPEEVVDIFVQLRKHEIKGTAIILGYQGAAIVKSDRSVDEAIKFADELTARIRNGEPADKLAKKYSDDPGGKKKSGILDPYNPGMFDLAVDKAIATAGPGDVLDPIFTEKGIFLISISEKKPLEVDADPVKVRTDIKKQLFQRFFRDEGAKNYAEITETFKQNLNAEVLDKNISEFLERIKEWKAKPDFRDDQIDEQTRSIVLSKFDGGKFTGNDFLEKFAGRFYKAHTKYDTEDKIRNAVENQLNYDLWIQVAKDRKYDEDPVIIQETERLEAQKLSALLEERAVRDKISFTEDEVNAAYEKDKERYREKRKIQIGEILIKDKNKAYRIYRQIKANPGRFGELADKYNEKSSGKRPGGDLGYQTDKSSLGEIIKKAFAAGPDQLLEPMQYGAYFYIIKTGDFQPERVKPLEEVITLVEGGIKRDKGHAIRNEMMTDLRNRFPYKINEKLIRELK